MRRRTAIRISAAFLSWAWIGGVSAQTAPTRIRGTIESVAPDALVVHSRDGSRIPVALSEHLTVSAVKLVDLGSIGPGTYVGVAARAVPGGGEQALEVLVFPESMRGAGEGHYPWDLEQGSTMTNGTVTGVVQANSGRELVLKYKDGSNIITVPPGVPVVTFAPAERSDLKPGAKVFLSATRNAQGEAQASRVTVEKAGVAPPM